MSWPEAIFNSIAAICFTIIIVSTIGRNKPRPPRRGLD